MKRLRKLSTVDMFIITAVENIQLGITWLFLKMNFYSYCLFWSRFDRVWSRILISTRQFLIMFFCLFLG